MAIKKKILVVDDSPIMTLIMGSIVSEDPLLQVAEYAADGLEALEKVSAVKPDLILLDIEMPKMNGVEFMRLVRSKSPAKVLVVTAEEPNSPKVAQIRGLGLTALSSNRQEQSRRILRRNGVKKFAVKSIVF